MFLYFFNPFFKEGKHLQNQKDNFKNHSVSCFGKHDTAVIVLCVYFDSIILRIGGCPEKLLLFLWDSWLSISGWKLNVCDYFCFVYDNVMLKMLFKSSKNVCLCVCVCVCVHAWMRVCVLAWMRVCVCLHGCVCVWCIWVCMRVCVWFLIGNTGWLLLQCHTAATPQHNTILVSLEYETGDTHTVTQSHTHRGRLHKYTQSHTHIHTVAHTHTLNHTHTHTHT